MLAMTEYLELAEIMEDSVDGEQVNMVMRLFQSRVEALVRVQDHESGLWHNILNNNQTFLETSASAMFLAGQ